ncbi:YqjF family protein [Natrarchaeobaculum sulfurireducens]|uniref:DUF2071 domain-containing protein n=1 Tax=Natrarchaeobaculum sulfurireducens TaxID=2044521 RepID=A0A346PIZ0_9EURY|nr:DUF2071 domain-containing protein [Natrarchaeobaculum sulfurireducens]AXR79485.1 hypothetical protein AArc1_3180 [Natrarchaeobaculum sulfurireducens]
MTEQRTDPYQWRVPDGASPTAPHIASMTWRDGLFAHWPIEPDALRPHVPRALTLETRDGSAWVSVLPFVLVNAGLRGTPSVTRLAFPELDVRTYVRYRGDPGLFFFSIDVGNSLVAGTVARTTRLPVQYARMRVGSGGEGVGFSSTRDARPFERDALARFEATYEPVDDSVQPEPGTLEHWLVERRRFYAPTDGGLLAGEFAHDPWPLQPADVTIHENTMFEANGLPTPIEEPIVHYCGELEMTGSIPRRV